MDARTPQCENCGSPLPGKTRGRPQRFCSDKCRQAHRKIIVTAKDGLRYRTGQPKPKVASQDSELLREFEPENLSQKTNLRFQRVNDVTFKLTDGESTNVPTSHGQWGGYRTTKAVAWVIKIGPNVWLARCGDRSCGPTTFDKAKADALNMARGSYHEVRLRDPVTYLNRLHARMAERDGEAE
jgi:hypothetical protein